MLQCRLYYYILGFGDGLGRLDGIRGIIRGNLKPIISVTTIIHLVDTGGKGSTTQWVHAEYMEGSESIHPAFTQWVRGGYFSKVPTKVPTG